MAEDNRFEKDLVDLAKRFANAGKALYLSLLSTFVAFILQISSLATASWVQNENARSGLWTFCNSTTEYECCHSLESIVMDKKWLSVSQTFLTLGLFPGVVAGLSVSMLTCISVTPNSKCKVRRVAYVTNLIAFTFSICAASMTIIAVSVYGSRYRIEPFLKELDISMSLVFGILSLFLFFFSALILALHTESENSQSPRHVSNLPNATPSQHESSSIGTSTEVGVSNPSKVTDEVPTDYNSESKVNEPYEAIHESEGSLREIIPEEIPSDVNQDERILRNRKLSPVPRSVDSTTIITDSDFDV